MLEKLPDYEGSILVPDYFHRWQPHRGYVRACGNAVLDISVGDLVLFPRKTGYLLRRDGKAAIILPEDEVLAVINGEKDEST